MNLDKKSIVWQIFIVSITLIAYISFSNAKKTGICVDCGKVVVIKRVMLFEWLYDGIVLNENQKYIETGISLFLNKSHKQCNNIIYYHICSEGLLGEARMTGSGSGHKRLLISSDNPHKLCKFLKYFETSQEPMLEEKIEKFLKGEKNKQLKDKIYSYWNLYLTGKLRHDEK
jgi:hypothetical protein